MSEPQNEARGLIGVPWRHQGRHPVHGLDCIGLVVEAFRRSGATVRDQTTYGRVPKPAVLLAALESHLARLPDGTEPVAGDVLVFALIGGRPQHVAIATGDGTMVHTDQHVRRVVEVRLSPAWRRRLHSIWRKED